VISPPEFGDRCVARPWRPVAFIRCRNSPKPLCDVLGVKLWRRRCPAGFRFRSTVGQSLKTPSGNSSSMADRILTSRQKSLLASRRPPPARRHGRLVTPGKLFDRGRWPLHCLIRISICTYTDLVARGRGARRDFVLCSRRVHVDWISAVSAALTLRSGAPVLWPVNMEDVESVAGGGSGKAGMLEREIGPPKFLGLKKFPVPNGHHRASICRALETYGGSNNRYSDQFDHCECRVAGFARKINLRSSLREPRFQESLRAPQTAPGRFRRVANNLDRCGRYFSTRMAMTRREILKVFMIGSGMPIPTFRRSLHLLPANWL